MQSTLSRLPVAVRALPDGRGSDRVRRSEWVVLAFLLYAQLLALALPAATAVQYRVCAANSVLMLAYAALIGWDLVKPNLAASVVRDWLPLAAVILAYREMGWFAQPHAGAALESRWIVWDRLVLRDGGRSVIEALGPVIPSILEVAYALVYALAPFAIAVLYLNGYCKQVDSVPTFVLGVLMCYAQFPFWPSEPPRVVFAGQDLPTYYTIFRRFNLWMLGNYGIHTSVFPSAHVAGAFAAAFGIREAMSEHKWVSRMLLAMAILIGLATVYGRYHYLADATAGLVVAVLAVALTRQLVPQKVLRRLEPVAKHQLDVAGVVSLR